ncbi:hypothetical protein F5877DRAFT_79925 [Lentinula edodes]|nr:hypothetical protein F5877DRAFT_79925 [Lentinula edodes]
MRLRSLFFQSVFGVVCLFAAVRTMPIELSKGPSKSAAAAFHVNASVLVESNDYSQNRHWEKWWGQLDQMALEDLTEKIRRRASSVPRNYGRHNLAIFTLSPETREFQSLPGDQIVVKLVDYDNESSSCEVSALRRYAEFQKAKGQTPTFVTSGVLKRTALPCNIGVIVMRKVPGQGLEDTDQWREKIRERQGMLDKVFKNIQNFNYEFIEKTKLVHVDLGLRNFPVDEHMNVYPIDFGPPSIYPVERVPSRSEFDAWFSKRFDLIWGTQQGGKY